MGFDYSCLNLELLGSKPTLKDDAQEWQTCAALQKAMYDTWKGRDDKRVAVDGVKYRLVPIVELPRHGKIRSIEAVDKNGKVWTWETFASPRILDLIARDGRLTVTKINGRGVGGKT